MPLLIGISGNIMSLFVKRKQYAVKAKIVAAALMPKPREPKRRRTGQKRKRKAKPGSLGHDPAGQSLAAGAH